MSPTDWVHTLANGGTPPRCGLHRRPAPRLLLPHGCSATRPAWRLLPAGCGPPAGRTGGARAPPVRKYPSAPGLGAPTAQGVPWGGLGALAAVVLAGAVPRAAL